MFDLVRLGFGVIVRLFRSREALLIENLVLRQQLAVFKRKHSRPRLAGMDKCFWIVVRRFWSSWKTALIVVTPDTVGHLSYSQVPALAKRHKVEAKKDSASAQELLTKQVSTYDDSELCKLLLEISLLDSAYQRSTASRDDVLMDAAKRYRVDAEKLQKAVAKEFVAKRDKKTIKLKARKTAA